MVLGKAGTKELLTLVAIAAAALGLLVATPWLIVPYRASQAWYESAATFPRIALAVAAIGAVIETLRRLRGGATVASEELDSSAASLPRVVAVLALFGGYALLVPVLGFGVSSAAFVALAGRAVGLGWRASLLLALPLAVGMRLVFVEVLKVAFGHGVLF